VLDVRAAVGVRDLVLITLDTLRHDVAVAALADGRTPHLAARIGAWERRHSPATFTYAAHQAFFAGFLPTPATPGRHQRAFACRVPGAETIGPGTWVCEAPDIVHGLADAGYHTICIGGTGFFSGRNPLGSVLPGLFAEHHWTPRLGVGHPQSPQHQVDAALRALAAQPATRRVLLFINVSALHRPNHIFVPGATRDTPATMAAALAAVDAELGRLFAALDARAPWCGIVCSDHGEAYGEDGWHGHRLAHPVVWEVPYAEFLAP
jgi:hypothetical protein